MKKPQSKQKNKPQSSKTKQRATELKATDAPLEHSFSDLRQELEEKLSGVVQGRKVGEAADIVLSIVQEEFYSGPLPHPRHLKAYEDICPGMADRMLTMTEKTVDANNAIPEMVITAESKYSRLGLVLGFIVMLALVISAVICTLFEKPLAAGIFMSVACMGAVAKFVDGRMSKSPVNPPSASKPT